MILGGSTNAVLHLIAIGHSVGINLTIDDFQSVSDRVPFIADLKPSGKYVMEDVYKIGGIPGSLSALCISGSFFGQTLFPSVGNYIPFSGFCSSAFPHLFPSYPNSFIFISSDCLNVSFSIRSVDLISPFACAAVLHYLLKNKLIDGNTLTVTGNTLGENLERWVHRHGELSMTSQDVIRPLETPIKSTGHLRQVCPFSSATREGALVPTWVHLLLLFGSPVVLNVEVFVDRVSQFFVPIRMVWLTPSDLLTFVNRPGFSRAPPLFALLSVYAN